MLSTSQKFILNCVHLNQTQSCEFLSFIMSFLSCPEYISSKLTLQIEFYQWFLFDVNFSPLKRHLLILAFFIINDKQT